MVMVMFVVLRPILANKKSLLICLLIEFELIEFHSLLLSLTLELSQGLQSRLRLTLTLLYFFAIFNDGFSELLPDHTFDDILAVLLPWWTVSEEVVLRLLSVQDLNFDFL